MLSTTRWAASPIKTLRMSPTRMPYLFSVSWTRGNRPSYQIVRSLNPVTAAATLTCTTASSGNDGQRLRSSFVSGICAIREKEWRLTYQNLFDGQQKRGPTNPDVKLDLLRCRQNLFDGHGLYKSVNPTSLESVFLRDIGDDGLPPCVRLSYYPLNNFPLHRALFQSV